MSERDTLGLETAAALRRAFDQGFAEAPRDGAAAREDLLAVRVGAASYALKLAQVAALVRDPRLTPLPSPLPELSGLAGLRGDVIPVYDLGALLGNASPGPRRGLVLARAAEPVAFAFAGFEAQLRVESAALAPAPSDVSGPFVRQTVAFGEAHRPIVDLLALVEAVSHRAGRPDSTKEP